MGAANCCKKPTEIVIEEIKKPEEEKPNALDQDSYPQDTEQVQINENYIQEISNQKLYEQEGSPQFGEAYEVPINSSTPQQYNQIEQMYQIQNPQTQNIQNNQISQEELAQYNLVDPNQNININQGLNNKYDIQQSNVSSTGPVDITAFISTRSAAPVNQIQSVAKVQQIESQGVKQPQNQEEDLNKYFQLPVGQYTNILTKSKTSVPNEINMNEIGKLLQQQQQPNENVNVASVTPIEENEDLNKYFQNLGPMNINNNLPKEQEKMNIDLKEEKTEKETPLELKPVEINVNESLPETFGTYNIQQLGLQQHPETNTKTTTTTTTVIKKEENNDAKDFPQKLTDSQIKQIIDMKDLPDTFGSDNIKNFKQVTTTTTTETKGNLNLNNFPEKLTTEQINQIIDMKDLPETFGSNTINNFKQTTTTTTKTTQNVDLTNIPSKLTDEQIKQIINMEDLPETFGSNIINKQKQTTVTTTTTNIPSNMENKGSNDINNLKPNETTTTTTTTTQNIDLTNIPSKLTDEQIKQIINMEDLPETFGSNIINKQKQTTVTTTTTNIPSNMENKGSNDINNLKPNETTTTTTTTTQNIDLTNIPSKLTDEQIKQIINMEDLPETFGSNIINKNLQTTKTTTVTKSTQNIPIESDKPITARVKTIPEEEDYSKYFEQQGSTQQSSVQIDLDNIIHGSNITFKNPSQNINTSINNLINQPVLSQTSSTPITTEGLVKSNTNPIDIPGNYGLNNSQQKTTTTITTTKQTGIPTGSTFTQSYTLPSNYSQNKVTTTKVIKTSGPDQTLQYSNTMPIDINTSSNDNKKLW